MELHPQRERYGRAREGIVNYMLLAQTALKLDELSKRIAALKKRVKQFGKNRN